MAPADTPSAMPYSSLRPLPVGGHRPKNIGDFIARIQAERGFRNVSEASLREEITAKQARAAGADGDNDDVDMASGTGADDSDGNRDDDDAKDVYAVRNEILQNIECVCRLRVDGIRADRFSFRQRRPQRRHALARLCLPAPHKA